MNGAHLHLMLNHFPIAGVSGAMVLLTVSWISGSESLRRASLLLVVLTGLLTIPVFLTGEPAENVVERLPNVTQAMIEVHEEAAEKSAWAIWVTSLVSFGGLASSIKSKKVPAWVIPVVLMLSLGCIAMVAWSNNLGGQISHPELRSK